MCTVAMILWLVFHPAGERVFLVPSSAMAPTLVIGDRVVMVPFAEDAAPARGDVIAIRDPSDFRSVQMFRAIGLPGDRLRMVAGIVVLNGVPVALEAIGEVDVDFGHERVPAEVWRETLPNGRSFLTVDTEPAGFLDNTPEHAVPSGRYFVLGDNRDNAADSRLTDRLGYVPAANVLGRTDRVLASCSDDGRFIADRTGLRIGP